MGCRDSDKLSQGVGPKYVHCFTQVLCDGISRDTELDPDFFLDQAGFEQVEYLDSTGREPDRGVQLRDDVFGSHPVAGCVEGVPD